jgi:hypothetical protein
MITSAARLREHPGRYPVQTKPGRKGLDARIKERNLKRQVFCWPLLADELIHPRLGFDPEKRQQVRRKRLQM